MTLISIGYPQTLTQSVVYACPAKACYVVSNAALEFSLDGTNFTAVVAATTTGTTSAFPFVRCTTGNAIVSFKPVN